MKDLIWEMKYELTRTLKHIFYVLLVVCWFALWYGIFGLCTGVWNVNLWTDGIWQMYCTFSIITGFGYGMYRIMT
jgi:hypothetical protein